MPRLSTLTAALAVLAFGLQVAAGPAAAQSLVDAAWLQRNRDNPNVVILDVRNELGKGSAQVYRAGHIPGAIHSDYLKAGWRAKVDGVVGQLPPVADLEKLIGGLGIGNDSHVIVVAGGVSALDMGSATRVYWTFKVLGHDKVSVFDGGYRAYAADPANPVETGSNSRPPTTFQARFRPEMVADHKAVQTAKAEGQALIDFRPPPQYLGSKAHPMAKRPGTIPGAVNVPESELTDANGRFVAAARVASLLEAVGVETEDDAISFCNTGHWASLGWFARSEILGQKNVTLYDGSMVDWTARPELPVEVKAK